MPEKLLALVNDFVELLTKNISMLVVVPWTERALDHWIAARDTGWARCLAASELLRAC